MGRRPSLDLHVAESAAEVAAICSMLKVLLRSQLKDLKPAERAARLDELLQAAESITLPVARDPNWEAAMDCEALPASARDQDRCKDSDGARVR